MCGFRRYAGSSEPFYPQSLEKGLRSERALKIALAEMYVQGVSTRKVAAITEKLLRLRVTSTQVSRAAADLDTVLKRGAIALRRDAVSDPGRTIRKGAAGRHCSREPRFLSPLGWPGRQATDHRCVCGTVRAGGALGGSSEELSGAGLSGVRLIVSDDHGGLKRHGRRYSVPCRGSDASFICSRTPRRMCRNRR
jgi:hypothetical protein